MRVVNAAEAIAPVDKAYYTHTVSLLSRRLMNKLSNSCLV